ncbi:MAG: hypothetical protein GF401_14150 [Chitinivibrionales bacterium]|nr:hypothetical protein [Chitinivibrionales bacterium]
MKTKSRNEIIQHLYSLTARGVKFGLEKISDASARLGNPHLACPSVHVAGTNGKGTTCACIESILRHYGKKTGLFLSPHLVEFEERFLINGKPVPPESWLDIYRGIEDCIEELDLTFFEVTTLIAFELFRRENVDWAIYEVGMGGRLDATNIIKPRISAITHIDLDHEAFLGTDLVSIAAEKLGIVKPETPVVMLDSGNSDVIRVAQKRCRENLAPLTLISPSSAHAVTDSNTSTLFVYKCQPYSIQLKGKHQVSNAMLALETAHLLGFSENVIIAEALKNVFMPARFQIVKYKGKTLVFDAAHNPGAIHALVSTLKSKFENRGICIVAGILSDKNFVAMITALCTIAVQLILTSPHTDRGAGIAALKESLPDEWKEKAIERETVARAMDEALSSSAPVVCCTGSFYTVGEAMQHLGIQPYG